ncbi:MAG: redox-regulated ATPase YchF [Deltaproteobacteria bacterium]|nr:redox-regulated ATPase YchF [Deltaproteobacteria bacterium]
MKVGLVGFAGSGKTTLFNALTGLKADTGFGGKEAANLGMIKVPDARVDFLAEIFKPKKKTLAEIGFVDVAGPDAKKSEKGLDAKLVADMRLSDALVHVVRGFDNPALTRPPDLLRDLEEFEAEMVFSDLVQVESRLDRIRKEGKKGAEKTFFETLAAHMEAGNPLRTLALSEADLASVSGFAFLSQKPCMVLCSVADDAAGRELGDDLKAAAKKRQLTLVHMAGRAEAEISELGPEEQAAFLADLGVTAPARARFIAAAYAQLELISFLTTGEDECRAWTIKRGTVARRAAGKIHSDIERGFIRAEVIPFADFKALGTEAKCREAGKLRLEGKEYVVQDGDIVHFRFNV